MTWSRVIFPIVILLLAGCMRAEEQPSETPTAFPSTGMTIRAPIGEPIAISLANLAANPGLFEGANLRLSGQFQPLPRLICEQESFPSPATWGLVGEGLMANATGYDGQLRELINTGQVITVEGRWLHYEGPVGCGKSANVQEIWYLSTSRIVDPNPLSRSAEVIVIVPPEPSATTDLMATGTMTATVETAVPTGTPVLTETVTVTAPATFVPSVTPSATTAPPAQVMTLTPSPTVPTLVPAGTATNTPTPTGGSPTASPTGTTATPTATATATTTSSGQEPVNKGSPEFEDLIIANLDLDAVDAWTVNVSSSTAVTITVAPELGTDIVFTVLANDGQVLVNNRDQAAAGGVETIRDLNVANTSAIEIQVSADPARETDYALMVMDEASYSFIFEATLDFDSQRTGTLEENVDHFWFFSATDGDNIDLQITPDNDADAYVEIYGADGTRIRTIDDGDIGEVERLENYSILETGFYSIRVGEFDYGPMTYQIILDES